MRRSRCQFAHSSPGQPECLRFERVSPAAQPRVVEMQKLLEAKVEANVRMWMRVLKLPLLSELDCAEQQPLHLHNWWRQAAVTAS